MTWRLYTMPIIGAGTRVDPRRPKYAMPAAGWAMMDYGLIPFCLVAADTTNQEHNALTGNADVLGFATDIDTALGGSANSVRTALEAITVPGDWFTGSTTWRQVARNVAGLFQFAQRYHGTFGAAPAIGGGLNTQWGNIDSAERDRLTQVAASLGYDLSAVTSTTQLRAVLRLLSESWGGQPFFLGSLVF